MTADPRRSLPSVDAVLRSEPGRRAAASLGRPIVKRAVTDAIVDGWLACAPQQLADAYIADTRKRR